MTVGDFQDDSLINCPRCHTPNPSALIYCDDENCAAILHPGRITCEVCHAAIPVNTRFCPECGRATA